MLLIEHSAERDKRQGGGDLGCGPSKLEMKACMYIALNRANPI